MNIKTRKTNRRTARLCAVLRILLFCAPALAASSCARRTTDVQTPSINATPKTTARREPVTAPKPKPPVLKLTLSQAIGLRMIYGYDGFTPPPRLRRLIARGEASGVIIFKRNVKNVSHLAATMRALQAIRRPRGLNAPLLIMVDQEGGRVKRLPGAPTLSPAQIGRVASLEDAQQVAYNEGVATGRSLRKLGINVNLAPVVDVARPDSHTEQWSRSYGRNAQRVSTLAASFARGMAQEGTLACWKHFPGLGGAMVNEDLKVNTLSVADGTLQDVDLLPFREAPPNSLVMTSTAIYPVLDRRPAMFSSRVVRTVLRKRVGFKGLAITDDLQVPAMKSFGSPTRRGLLSIRAGNDLLLYCQSLNESETALRELTQMAQRRELDADELQQTALRIVAFRAKMKTT